MLREDFRPAGSPVHIRIGRGNRAHRDAMTHERAVYLPFRNPRACPPCLTLRFFFHKLLDRDPYHVAEASPTFEEPMTSTRTLRSTPIAARPGHRPSDWRIAFGCVKSGSFVQLPEPGLNTKPK